MGNKFAKIDWFNNRKKKLTPPFTNPKTQSSSLQRPPPPPDHHLSHKEFVRALFNYIPQNEDDLKFNKGDVLIVISKKDDPWWLAEHSLTKSQGFIPSNFVIDDGKPCLEAWFDIERPQAIQLLLRMGNPSGTYIVRPSSAINSFALSVRFESEPNYWDVHHYKILESNGSGYYINEITRFPSIADLIDYYSNQPGLCCRLSQPCPRVIKPPVQFRDLEVARQSIKYVKPLGQGYFGEVFQGKWNNVLDVAVKKLKSDVMGKARFQFIKEAQSMHKLHHDKIVQILGVCTKPDNEPCLIITELMINGSLLDFLRKGEGRQMDFNQLLDVIGQVASGMKYLERMNFVHRDLRAANILVGENYEIKVADFGLSHCVDDEIYVANEETKFPVKWTALEALTDKIFSTKSDVWSFGVLIYEVVTYGLPPYEGMSNQEVIKYVKAGHRLTNPNGKRVKLVSVYCPDELFEIMSQCWDKAPEKRYTFEAFNDIFEDYIVEAEPKYETYLKETYQPTRVG